MFLSVVTSPFAISLVSLLLCIHLKYYLLSNETCLFPSRLYPYVLYYPNRTMYLLFTSVVSFLWTQGIILNLQPGFRVHKAKLPSVSSSLYYTCLVSLSGVYNNNGFNDPMYEWVHRWFILNYFFEITLRKLYCPFLDTWNTKDYAGKSHFLFLANVYFLPLLFIIITI